MIDKNLFIQDLKYVYTVLQELKVNEEMIKQLIDKYNLTEENLDLTNTELEEIKTYIDSIKEFIVQNNITTEIGGNMEIDGKLDVNSESTFNSNVEIKAPLKTTSSTEFNGTNTFNNDVTITGELYLPSSNSLIFEDGSQLGGGGKLYKHNISIEFKSDPDQPYGDKIGYLTVYNTNGSQLTDLNSLIDTLGYDVCFAGVCIPTYDGAPFEYSQFKECVVTVTSYSISFNYNGVNESFGTNTSSYYQIFDSLKQM